MKLSQFVPALLSVLILSHFENAAASDEQKAALKNSSVENRLEAISRADVMNENTDRLYRETPEQIPQIDMTEELKQICGAAFNYNNNQRKENVGWPTVNCKYKQDNLSLSGATKKFNCDFNEVTKKGKDTVKKRKVKYASYFKLGSSELVPTILASTIARMLGFYTEAYCPAKVKCEGCPSSDPWADSNRSSAAPSAETHAFEYAMVERPADLMTITMKSGQPANAYPHGVFWKELLSIKETDGKTKKDKAIEREAWVLWINFLVDTDAFNFNQRISCAKASGNGEEIFCEKPVAYTHDYGHAFNYRFNFEKWKTRAPLIQNKDGSCRGGLTGEVMKDERGSKDNNHLHISPLISSEARDLLVGRMRLITDKQWRDIFRISNAERLFRVSTDDWLSTVREKIEIMGRVQCAPFDSRTSVFSAGI